MIRREAIPQNGNGPEFDSLNDGLASLETALAAYLEEIDEYRNICLQHERTTAVFITGQTLRIVKQFGCEQRAVAYLREATNRLPIWKKSPFFATSRKTWIGLEKEATERNGTGASARPLLARGIAWEGWPILVCAWSIQEQGLLQLDLCLPPVATELPELPLRRAATALRCHAHLLPDWVARPRPLPKLAQPGSLMLREFLERAMPQNLYASQCLSLRGAEQ